MPNKVSFISSLLSMTAFLSLGFAEMACAGEPEPSVGKDLQQIINKAVAAGEKRIVIPPGRYYAKPVGDTHLTLSDLHDVEIVADGVELVCTETTVALKMESCSNIVLRGLAVDYDPLPFTQGRIVEMSDDKRVHTVELMKGYPPANYLDAYEIFDPKTRELSAWTYYGCKIEQLGSDRVRISKPSGSKPEQALEKLGDLAVLNYRHVTGNWSGNTVWLHDCQSVTIDRVTLYTGPCFGFMETNCKDSSYLNCVVDRRPLETDSQQREQPRLRSLNRDAFHSCASERPIYRNCIAKYNGDDGIAIQGHYSVVLSSDGQLLRIVDGTGYRANKQLLSFLPGDTIEIMLPSGLRLPDAKLVSVEPADPLTEEEKAFINKMGSEGWVRLWLLKGKVMKLTLDRPTDSLPMGSLAVATNRSGSGFEISNCQLGPSRARGVVIKANNGKIENCSISGYWLYGIMIVPELNCLEGGNGDDITISGNVIRDGRDAAIAVLPARSGNGKAPPAGVHNDIRIVGNEISNCPNPAIAVASTKGLLIRDNKIEKPNTKQSLFSPWSPANALGRKDNPKREVFLENVEPAKN